MPCTKFILFNSGDTSVNFTYTKCSDNQIETQVELLPNERKTIWAINDDISFPILYVGNIDIIEKSIFPITPTPTRTPFQQISPRPTKTPTPTPTTTKTPTPTSTKTPTPTSTKTPTPTATGTQTPTTTKTPTPTATGTPTPTSTASGTPIVTVTQETPTPTPTATGTPTPTTTKTPTPTPSSTRTGCSYILSSVAEANPSSGNTVWLVSSISGSTTNNPNTINEAYWNTLDSNGTDRTDFFSGFTGTSVFVSFTQNNETAVYSGNTSSFTTWYDTPTNTGFVLSNISGSTVLITSASTIFNFDETVIINISNNNG